DGSPLQATYRDTISHIFPDPGMYIVELTALDTNGCSAIAYGEVMIDALPTAQFTNTTGSCDNPTVFTDISLGGGEFIEFWYWDFGDISSGANNTSTLQNPTHLYGPYDSTYQVKLIVTNFNGCIDSTIQEVYVEPCLIAGFGLPSGLTCARYELCFTDTSMLASNNGVISQWRWDFGDGNTYNYGIYQNPICHTYQDGGDYDVQLIIVATINGTSYNDTVTKTLIVHPTPLAGITVVPNCLGDSTMFYDATNPNNEPLTMWHWDFGDTGNPNDTSIIQNPAYLYPTYGTYATELKVMNQYGCRDSITTTVDIYKPPEAAFSFEELCMSYNTYFLDESLDDSSAIVNYLWNFGNTITIGDTSNLQDPTYIYDTTGYYTVELIVTDGNQCKDTITHDIEIYPIPTSGFIIMDTVQQGQIYLDNISIGAINYYWDFDYNYGQSSTETNPTHQYDVDGSYTIMLVSYNDFDCPDTTYQIYDLLFTNLFVPNAFVPSNSNPELQTFKPIGINLQSYRLEVYSAWGNLVFESTSLDNGAPAVGWDGTYENEALPTGSYIWRISAVFEDGTIWKGTDNGDGNTATSGTVALIR
ncbi:MAG: PKD domain-containing protein, partial [Bacteroidetes bacterium]|nr:PKD domain-containing protein [Bacteroidota bacterium]